MWVVCSFQSLLQFTLFVDVVESTSLFRGFGNSQELILIKVWFSCILYIHQESVNLLV